MFFFTANLTDGILFLYVIFTEHVLCVSAFETILMFMIWAQPTNPPSLDIYLFCNQFLFN